MDLIELKLKNFKGCRNIEIHPQGRSLDIFGRNETGKTTLLDAISWLLWDKDTLGRSTGRMGIKTRNVHPDGTLGEEIRGLDHEVEATFREGGETFVLRKVYTENWSRIKGSQHEELVGHSTDHYVNDVPHKQKDFKTFIDGIIDEKKFRMISDPTYFAEQLPWQERRPILYEMSQGASQITDDQVIARDPRLSAYPRIAQGRTLEQTRAILLPRRSKTLEDLSELATRKDEVLGRLKDEPTAHVIPGLEQEISTLRSGIEALKSGNGVGDLKNELSTIRSRRVDAESRMRADFNESKQTRIDDNSSRLNDLRDRLDRQVRERDRSVLEASAIQKRLADSICQKDALLQDTQKVKGETYEPHNPVCDTCGQALPPDPTATRERFNTERAEKIKALSARMEELDRIIAQKSSDLQETRIQVAKSEASNLQVAAAVAKLEQERGNLLSLTPPALEAHPEIVALVQREKELQDKIDAISIDAQPEIARQQERLATIEAALKQQEAAHFIIQSNLEVRERAREIDRQQAKLREQIEDLESDLFILDLFEKEKAELITNNVNSLFPNVRWRLFREQINGGIDSNMCEPVFRSVPFSEGLNNAGRIWAGIEICQVLQKHFGVKVPIWVDNAESVDDISEARLSGSQIFATYVDRVKDKLEIVPV